LPSGELADGQLLKVAGVDVTALHTPDTRPARSASRYRRPAWCSAGDTLFAGGPGATGRSYSDFPTILTSIRERLLTLPPETVVHPGHGESTTIGAEAGGYDEWVRRGH
jgi:glyoxylase-like metal-dependent hydrolase (beta-lactamase superfamily II)